jgi:hypothetical protein
MGSATTIIALSKGWVDSIGLVFVFGILMPAVMNILVVISMISGRGEKAQDAELAGRWGRKPPNDA